MSNANNGHVELVASIETINGYAMSYKANSRFHFDNLSDDEYVLFRSQLNEDVLNEAGEVVSKDERVVLGEMAVGPTATPESRKQYVKLIDDNEQELKELGMSMVQDGQLSPLWCVADGDGLKLCAGTRRLLALWYAIALLPEVTAPLKKVRYTLTNSERADALSSIENRMRKALDPLSEAWQYWNYKTQTGATALKTAEYFGCINKTSRKPDGQRVSQLVRLWGPEVSDKTRAMIRDGKMAVSTVLQRLKDGKKGSDLEVAPVLGKRGRPSKTETAAKAETVAVEATETVATPATGKKVKINWDDLATVQDAVKTFEEKYPAAAPVEYFRYAAAMATGKEYAPLGTVEVVKDEVVAVEAPAETLVSA